MMIIIKYDNDDIDNDNDISNHSKIESWDLRRSLHEEALSFVFLDHDMYLH